jgi:hypothetical protein
MRPWNIITAGESVGLIIDEISDGRERVTVDNTPPSVLADILVAVLNDALRRFVFEDEYEYRKVLSRELQKKLKEL